jgi:hypothetical protein
VDLSRSPARFGPDVRVGDVPCKTVLFTARGMYGDTEVAIGTQDGLIRRIRCDGAPLREEMQKARRGKKSPRWRPRKRTPGSLSVSRSRRKRSSPICRPG